MFYVTSFLGLVIMINAIFTNRKLEAGAEDIIKMTFWKRTKLNFREIYFGLQIRPILKLIVFFFIFCSIVPVYTNYFYYYITDILGFSNFQYSMLNVVGSLALLICMYCYNLWFKETETWLMLGICCIINSLGGINAMLLIRGFCFGMDPKVFVFLTTTVTDTL